MVKRSLFIAAVAVISGVAGAHPGFRIREFPGFNSSVPFIRGLNDYGQFVGNARAGLYQHALVFSFDSGYTEVPFSGTFSMFGNKINNSGVICGDSGWRSFKWSATQGITWLPPRDSRLYYWAQGISDNGDIIGWELDSSGYWQRSVSWDSSNAVTDWGPSTYLQGINASGRMIGVDTVSAFYQDQGQSRQYLPPIAGVTGISDNGTMCGVRQLSSDTFEAVLWSQDGQSVTSLGQANAINIWSIVNDRSEVVWSKYPNGSNVLQGQYWSPTTGLRTIDSMIEPSSQSLQYSVMEVLDINNLGQMVAIAKKPWQQSWEGETILLDPVPEPATFAALGLGVLGILRRRRASAP